MNVIFLVPGLISLFLVWRGWIETAFLSVYLPCLLCLPGTYQLRIPHLPPISAAQFALIPLGLVGLFRLIRGGSYAVMDLLVLLFAASIGLSEILHAPIRQDGILSAITAFISIFLSYVVGRTLIEPDLRLATVRRFVILVLLNLIPGLYEWRMQQSLYAKFADSMGISNIRVFVQPRNGHGRMGEVFGGGEPGGIAFAMTFCLNAWLVYLRRVRASVDLGNTLAALEKYHVPGLLLFMCLLLTQSRGPLIALAAGYLILQITRFKRTRIITIVVAALLIAGYLIESAHFASFADIDPATMTEQQSSAHYRVLMNKLYPPIAEEGGWTGYGVSGIPYVGMMTSIDNHYLLVHLAWGRLGYILFVLIIWENIRVMVVRSWRLESLEDRAFIFSMLAAMAVLWITLLTVFLGGQLPEISFLLIGWMQSMVPGHLETSPSLQIVEARNQKFSFRQVFT